MPETSFEQTAVMNANKSTIIAQYTTENLNREKNCYWINSDN